MTARGGFTLPELLVALVLTMVVALGAMTLVEIAERAAAVIPAASDVQQRARVAADELFRAIGAAGAGFDGGALRGPLRRWVPPILPRRLGSIAPDAPHAARADAITVLTIPGSALQTMTAADTGSGRVLEVVSGPFCPATPVLCRAPPGAGLLVFDARGHFDLFNLADVTGALSARTASGFVYPPPAAVAGIVSTTFYLDAASHQLREYDNDRTDVPLVDDVVDLRFEYLADVAPPTEPKPPIGVASCLYDADGSLRPLPALTATDGPLAALPLTALSDGPWCGSGDTQFDVDALRVRAVRVTIRVQSAQPTRGTWFSAPDIVLAFVVFPRNLQT